MQILPIVVLVIMRIGTLNCQGLVQHKVKKQHLADDFEQYKIDIFAIQETHLKESGVETITSSSGKKYHLYFSGHKTKSINGVGIISSVNSKVEFIPISDRLCQITIKDDYCKIIVLSAYAPTEDSCNKNPCLRENFYNMFDSVLKSINSRDIVFIGGDFNSKTGSAYKLYNTCMGKFGKGDANENGFALLELAKSNNLKLTNTFFRHQPAHVTTWECPERNSEIIDSKSGVIRRNPYRNQVDYILVKNRRDIQVTDSRSYGGIKTKSDHKLVMATLQTKWPYSKKPKSNIDQINYEKISDSMKAEEYKNVAEQLFLNKPAATTNQQRWTNIVECSLTAAKQVFGLKETKTFSEDKHLQELSKKQKMLKEQIDSTKDHERRNSLRIDRNKCMNEIHNYIKERETQTIENQIAEIEQASHDSQKMFKVIKQVSKQKKSSKLLIKSENGLTADEQKQADLIAEYFKGQLYRNAEHMPNVKPTPMLQPFTSEEIKAAIKSLKNNKSTGIDNVKAELLKVGPDIFCDEIATIFNVTAATGEFPIELVLGIITALQKPRKKKGPIENLRPITLLSVLRKILATCMIKRTGQKLDSEIPISQAAYRKGRSTTEHVFACKILAEKAATSTDFEIHFLLLDMSKAFDTIIRSELIKDLTEILNDDELHLTRILLETELTVRVGNSKSAVFKTDTGAPQGDCMSGTEFTYYLAKTLQAKPNVEHNVHEHNYCMETDTKVISKKTDYERILVEHNYCSSQSEYKSSCKNIDINMEYADDMTEATTNKNIIDHVKTSIAPVLKKRGLEINEDKTEEYTVIYKGDQDWKDAKILGSKLDTEHDIKKRKCLTLNALRNLKDTFTHKHLSLETKIRVFEAYITPIFLYNSELWTLTQTMKNQIDSFHRRLIRSHVLNIRWPKIIKNDSVYERTKLEPWSKHIDLKRMKWFGHLMRLSPETPARQALKAVMQPSKRPRGKPKLTWIKLMNNQLESNGMSWELAGNKAKDRVMWRSICNSM